MMRNSLICKLINVQASMKENNENARVRLVRDYLMEGRDVWIHELV